MSNLAALTRATHVEISLALGGKLMISREAYLALDAAQLAGSVVRVLSRREVIARRARRRAS
jgi:hypothetical protein